MLLLQRSGRQHLISTSERGGLRHQSTLHTATTAAPAIRQYLYFIDSRGSLFHVFDVDGTLNAPLMLLGVSSLTLSDGIAKKVGTPSHLSTYATSTWRKKLPSGPTFLRETKFLDFFFQRLEWNHDALSQVSVMTTCAHTQPWRNLELVERRILELSAGGNVKNHHSKCIALHEKEHLRLVAPWVSPCGPLERNYIIAEDAPIVFHDLQWRHDAAAAISREAQDLSLHRGSHEVLHHTSDFDLVFGGSLRQPFRPESVRCSPDGRLYHPVDSIRHRWLRKQQRQRSCTTSTAVGMMDDFDTSTSPPPSPPPLLMGLLGPQVALRLGLDFISDHSTDENPTAVVHNDELATDDDPHSADKREERGQYTLEWLNVAYRIPYLGHDA